jgi:homoserine kinase type II
MPAPDLDGVAREVVARYPAAAASVEPLGNHGGFSGARLWRVPAAAGPLCLRAWPPHDPGPDRLSWLHGLMAAACRAGLRFVPAVRPARGGATWVAHGGRLWDLTAWMPGRADFRHNLSAVRLGAACSALARLHEVWARLAPAEGPGPGLRRRLEGAEGWHRLVRSGWRPAFPPSPDPIGPWAERAWRLLPGWMERVPDLLRPWAGRRLPLHPCLCDVWHDHVLFDGDRVSGLVDYGSVKVDHAAVDLARLLGSLAGEDSSAWACGLEAYAAVRPLSSDEQALTRALETTGTVLAAANWLRWLYHDNRTFEDASAVAERLADLVRRLEGNRAP